MPQAKKPLGIAICGASGLVGREMLQILENRKFPVRDLRLLASSRSAGEQLSFCGEELTIEAVTPDSFKGCDLALFSPGAAVSLEFAPLAAKANCIVIDNTSAFRMDPQVPLVVPEVNPEDIQAYSNKGIIANPNCSTIQMVVVLKPIDDQAHIRRVVVSTYQSVSGAGRRGIQELENQSLAVFNLKPIEHEKFPKQIAFNCLPQIDLFLEDGYTKEERKMMQETQKIMHRPDLGISATTVRVPVFYGHGESVNLELEQSLSPEEARTLLSVAPGVEVLDDVSSGLYPTAIDAAGRDETLVGRIRKDPSLPHGLDLWIVADNVRKGAALNAVQIAEVLLEKYL